MLLTFKVEAERMKVIAHLRFSLLLRSFAIAVTCHLSIKSNPKVAQSHPHTHSISIIAEGRTVLKSHSRGNTGNDLDAKSESDNFDQNWMLIVAVVQHVSQPIFSLEHLFMQWGARWPQIA